MIDQFKKKCDKELIQFKENYKDNVFNIIIYQECVMFGIMDRYIFDIVFYLVL